MSMGVGLTVVIALFIDAGTVTADFNRWAADSKSVARSRPSARFPVANLIAMLVGGVMTAALADAERQSLRRRQHVRLSSTASRSAWLSRARLHLPLRAIWARSARTASITAATGWSRIRRQQHAHRWRSSSA
jgi:cytosine permease